MAFNLRKVEATAPDRVKLTFDTPLEPMPALEKGNYRFRWWNPLTGDWIDISPYLLGDPVMPAGEPNAVEIPTPYQPAGPLQVEVSNLTNTSNEGLGQRFASGRGLFPVDLRRDSGTVGEWLVATALTADIASLRVRIPNGTEFEISPVVGTGPR